MATKSPTISVRSREIIGVDQFSQRREVFDKHDTVFLPLPSPTIMAPSPATEPILTSNHGKTTSNFKRNAPGYSSMREMKTDENYYEFRPRKYSDNFTSEQNQSDDVDYRYSMTERTRRLSKLRRDFLTSNLHEPTNESPFARTGMRASMPAQRSGSVSNYKIGSPVIYKFAFTEPYTTPTPVRRVIVDLGPSGIEKDNIDKENEDPELRNKHHSLPNNDTTSKIDHQKLFEELVKRYSPQRKPVDWTLPPTKPRVVASVPKSTSSTTDSVKNANSKEELSKSEDDDVFNKKEDTVDSKRSIDSKFETEIKTQVEIIENGVDTLSETHNKENVTKNRDSKISLTEEAEKNDKVPELSTIQRQISKESAKKAPHNNMEVIDLTIPALIEKMTVEGEGLENQKTDKKVKRKRSFLDKLLGRNKKDKVKQ